MPARTLWRVQFGGWTPIGAEQTASGYEVAWKITGADQYIGLEHRQQRQLHLNTIGCVSGTSVALQSIETSFHQDLNGDGVIGVPPADGDRGEWIDQPDRDWQPFLSFIDSSGSGPSLKYAGADVVAGAVWWLDADRRGGDGKRL